jgi:polysaccharide biosynthesis/export protein
MSYKFFILILAFSGFFASCVPTKNLIYLQNRGDSSSVSVMPIPFKPYRMQVSDILNITISAIDAKSVSIFNAESNLSNITEESLYFNGYSIDDHGSIRMPILGEVAVLGMTADEIRVKIETALLKDHFKKEAGIFVSVKLSGFRYTINGEINSPGTKNLNQDKVSILEAIANAGDITITGNRKDVIISI